MRVRKLAGSGSAEVVLSSFCDFLLLSVEARLARTVVEVMSFRSAFGGQSYYYVCPSCHVTLEREYMAYCDRCGQRLDWEDHGNAKIIFPAQH